MNKTNNKIIHNSLLCTTPVLTCKNMTNSQLHFFKEKINYVHEHYTHSEEKNKERRAHGGRARRGSVCLHRNRLEPSASSSLSPRTRTPTATRPSPARRRLLQPTADAADGEGPPPAGRRLPLAARRRLLTPPTERERGGGEEGEGAAAARCRRRRGEGEEREEREGGGVKEP
uniref:Uncharacterized protein n=1 Tax=Oryza glumipatula TaxID=40148 RepID=A0A0E0AZ47_9ORYZ